MQVKGTVLLRAGPAGKEEKALQAAAKILQEGRLVAFPTETVYGLGANAFDRGAVAKIFEVKNRPMDKPLIVHLADLQQVGLFVEDMPPAAVRLAQQFWPGPLTLVLPKNKDVPQIITGGLSSVAVRVPAHPLALGLIRKVGFPLVAPSANLSGRPSPTTAAHVLDDLAGRIAAVLDGGPCPIGLESTVLSLISSPPVLLRPGGIELAELEGVYGSKILEKRDESEVVSPSSGQQYKHYAPRVPLYLVEGAGSGLRRRLIALSENLIGEGHRVGVILFAESQGGSLSPVASFFASPSHRLVVETPGPRGDPRGAAERLFGVLRGMEKKEVDVIVVEALAEEGIGRAVMDRLRKAATKIIRADTE